MVTTDFLKYISLLYDKVRFPVQVIEHSGNIVYVNEAFTILWGYHLDELIEYSIFNDNVLKGNKILNRIFEVINGKPYTTIDYFEDSLLRSRDYAVPILRTNVFTIKYEDELYVVMYHEDQTEMLLTEEEVKKARDASFEAERLKNTFLNVLSHELRTPLNIILGYSSLIKENLSEKISAEDKIYLDNLHSGSERLFKGITQMLEFAQIEAGNFALNIETIDLISVIQNCIPNHKKQAEEKNLDLRTNFSHKKIFVDADIQCVENALNNLISNAVKFTHQGHVEVEVNLLEEKNLAVCKVRDTGIGISTKYLDHLYQPFSQEDLNVGRNYEGNGLGLALAKRYIEKLGGSLLVDSIKGVGSTFTFTLPLNQSRYLTTIIEKSESEKSNKILMIDNSGETYQLIKAFLKNTFTLSHHTIREFKLEYVQDSSFSHFIFDVDKNYWQQGILICKDIKRHDPFKRPIIIISSEYFEEKIKEFYQAGASRFLVKPFGKNDLTKIINETIE
ncbi:MAG: ATP-binding protein [Ignavibacteriaceae bacterium]|jgi:PAS domain S-box-containing protein|nr:ATP-binding protein [Ignavibacteriaceae bacterium]